MRNIIGFFKIALLLLFVCYGLRAECAGIFNLSYSLTEGGYRLSFSPVRNSRGITLRVDSSGGTRYEVIQRVITPLQPVADPGRQLTDVFMVRGLVGGNRYGTLRISSFDTPVRSEDVLYVSDASGRSDTITLIYSLQDIGKLAPGEYVGRLSFMVRPIGGSAGSLETKIVEISASIPENGISQQGVDITTPTGARTIVLNVHRPQEQKSDILIRLPGNNRQPLIIRQQAISPLESASGERLRYDTVQMLLQDKGSSSTVPLAPSPQVLYTVPPLSAPNVYVVSYRLSSNAAVSAGIYRTKIQYSVEEGGRNVATELFEFRVESDRVFDLIVTPPYQRSMIEFPQVKPSEPVKQSEVLMEVRSNIGRPYQVTQDILTGLVNKEGTAIPPEFFTVRTELVKGNGTVKFSQKEPVRNGQTVLFVSDKQGSPATFKVVYELRFPEKVPAGDYGSNATYSLLEM